MTVGKVVPPHVQKKVFKDDTIALRKMGHAGGRVAARKWQAAAEADAVFAARKAELRPSVEEEMYARAVEANEHICPPD